jgi:YEATS domain-containing protein 4
VKRVKGVELIVPIAYGTISFWLGKKAEEYEIDPLPLIYMSL